VAARPPPRTANATIPAQIAGIVAFAAVFIRATVGERAPIGELLPASVLATLAYALVMRWRCRACGLAHASS